MSDAIRIEGLTQLSRGLRRIDNEAPKGLRLVMNEAANVVVDTARPTMPRKSGRAQGAVRAKSTRTESRVSAGSSRAPYVPWLDYGGEGRIKGRPAKREFRKGGRYVYPAYHASRSKIEDVLERGLLKVVTDAGLEAD